MVQQSPAAVAKTYWRKHSDRLEGRSAAAGVAAINALGMSGSFVAPGHWGLLSDATSCYAVSLAVLRFMLLTAVAIVLWPRGSARRIEALAA